METSRLTELWQLKKQEALQKDEIRQTPEFQALTATIDDAMEKQAALLSVVPDHSAEFEAEKRNMIEYMRQSGQHQIGNVTAVVKAKREVNMARLLNVLDGDLDNLIVLAKVPQTALKDFAKTDDRKKELLACIEETGSEITDVNISLAA